MIKLILATVAILSSVSLQAKVLEVEALEEIREEIISRERSNLSFSNCNEYQVSSLTESTKFLEQSLDKLQSEVADYRTENLSKKEKSFLKKVAEKLACVKKKISGKLTYACSEEKACDTALMYVYRLLYVPKFLQKNVIYSCLRGYYNNSVETAGAILHEATHLCGTDDIEYLNEHHEVNSKPQLSYKYKILRKEDGLYTRNRTFSVDGSKNADSYRYWYLNRFCLPGRDC